MAKRRKDPSDKKSVPTRANSKMDSEEQEFWNLGDSGEDTPDDLEAPDELEDLEDLDDAAEKSESKPDEQADDSNDIDDSDDLDDLDDSDDSDDIDDLDDSDDIDDIDDSDDSDDIDDSGMNEDEDDLDDAEVGSAAEDDAPDTGAKTPRPDGPTSGKGERIALGVLGAVLLIALVWGGIVFMGTLPKGNTTDLVEFPVEGTAVTIADADTYWRKPDRTKDKGVRMDSRLIPAAVIKLKDTPGTCALRFFFSDDKGELVGDSTTHPVVAGKFQANSTNEIEVHGTAGFHDPGDHAAYTTEQIDAWHLVIMEGPDANAPGAKFKPIARVPISFNRK